MNSTEVAGLVTIVFLGLALAMFGANVPFLIIVIMGLVACVAQPKSWRPFTRLDDHEMYQEAARSHD